MPVQIKPKVGMQLLLPPEIKTRAQALAIVREESQAETLRVLITAALSRFEGANATKLGELVEAFAHMGVDYADAIHTMIKRGMAPAALYAPNGDVYDAFPGGVEVAPK